jgi:hypothetical protein
MTPTTRNVADVVFIVAVIVALLGGVAMLKSKQCTSQWADSGMAHYWRPLSGCMIQRKDGTWIPAKTYREVGG